MGGFIAHHETLGDLPVAEATGEQVEVIGADQQRVGNIGFRRQILEVGLLIGDGAGDGGVSPRFMLLRCSVVVDAAVDVGGVEVTEDLKGRRGLGLLGVALLERLQLPDLLLDLAGDRLLTFGLGLREGGAIGLELLSDGGHGTRPQQGPELAR